MKFAIIGDDMKKSWLSVGFEASVDVNRGDDREFYDDG